MRSLKISGRSLILFLAMLFGIAPSYFLTYSVMKLAQNGVAVLILLHLFTKKYSPTKIIVWIMMYFAFLFSITFINENMHIHTLIYYTKILLVLALIDNEMQFNPKRTFKIVFSVILLYVFIDFITVVAFPGGLYQATIQWNEWSSEESARWILGNKNSKSYWYMLALILSYIVSQYSSKKRIMELFSVVVGIASILTMLFIGANTTTVALFIIFIAILNAVKLHRNNIKLNTKLIVGGYVVALPLFLGGMVSFLQPIIFRLFGKDITFSGRSKIWTNAIQQIVKKPIAGWGIISNLQAQSLLGNTASVNAHNQWLQIMWEGGFILLGIFIVILYIAVSRLDKIGDKKISLVLVASFLSLLIEMLFEDSLSINITWIIIMCFYYVKRYLPELTSAIKSNNYLQRNI